jgi:hypothetical protein
LLDENGEDSNDETDDSSAPGSDTLDDEYEATDHETITGGGHANVTFVYTTDDGQGNTSSINETDNTTDTLNDQFDDNDERESVIVEVGSQQTSDSESDTDTQDATLHSGSVETTHAHDIYTSVNAATGFTVTGTYVDTGSTDTRTADLTEGTTDVKSASGPETLSGGFDDEESDDEEDHVRVSLHYVGVDPQGRILDLTETATQDDTVTDAASNHDQLAADGSDEDVLDDQKSAVGTVTDTLTGTMTTVNADETRTTVTFNDSLTDSSDAHGENGVTEETPAAGVTTDTPIHTIDGTGDFGWNINETIVVTDAAGNVISSGADIDSGGDNEQVQQGTADATATFQSAPYAAGVGQKTEPPGGYESPFFAGVVGFFRGLGTGVKALVNEGAKNVVQTAFLGTKEIGNLIAVDPINDVGYERSASAAHYGTGAALDLVTVGMSKMKYMGTAVKAIDKANDVVNAVDALENTVAGIADARQNGLNLQNGFQIVGGAIGGVGGIAAVAPMAKQASGLAPKVAGTVTTTSRPTRLNRLAARTSVQPRFWTKSKTFNGNKVFQRNDLIDPKLIDSRGRTNLERMQKGLAPIGPDGESIILHHLIQTQDGAIAEVTQTFHQKNFGTLHTNPNTIPSGIDRNAFNAWKRQYWIDRAGDFGGSP